MKLKTISLISLAIISLVFIFSVIKLVNYLQMDSDYSTIFDNIASIVDTLIWLPFILFFWKIYKG